MSRADPLVLVYRWVMGSRPDSGRFHKISFGPRVLIIGEPPL